MLREADQDRVESPEPERACSPKLALNVLADPQAHLSFQQLTADRSGMESLQSEHVPSQAGEAVRDQVIPVGQLVLSE